MVQLQKGFKTIEHLMNVTKKKLQKRYETKMVMITESNKARNAKTRDASCWSIQFSPQMMYNNNYHPNLRTVTSFMV